MVEVEAEAFWRLPAIVGQLIILLELNRAPNSDSMGGSLGELQRQCRALGIRSADRQLDRIKEHFTSGHATTASLLPMVKDLHQRLLDEFDGRLLLLIDPSREHLYRQSEGPPFGELVATSFPEAENDISEAAKCMALGRSTAAVFHLMRVLEVGLHVLSDATGAQSKNPNWENVLNGITKSINSMGPDTHGPDWKERQRAFSEAATQLRLFKNAWRNYVTHTRTTYDADSAGVIFASVREFMAFLATIEASAALTGCD